MVRSGLERHVVGRTVRSVEVIDARPLRRQDGGVGAFVSGLEGRTLTAAVRRGKFLWLPTHDGRALCAHLGMSGQLLVRAGAPAQAPSARAHLAPVQSATVDLTATHAPALVREVSSRPRHLRVRLHLSGRPGENRGGVAHAILDLVDQRMLGGMQVCDLVPTDDGAPGGAGADLPLLPAHAAHIARDLLDPAVEVTKVVERIRSSRRALKVLLLDQALVSGVGNIYADEALWYARVHGLRPGAGLRPITVRRVLEAAAEVMRRALSVGGTSFDALYVNTESGAGFFARELCAYGRAGRPCSRCATVMRSETIGGRSHTFCPRCQVRPRRR